MDKLTSDKLDSLYDIKDELFIIKFSSPSCGPCKTMKPVFKALDENNPTTKVFEVDTSESPELAAHFGIRGVPTTLFCENREVLYTLIGLTPLRDLQYVIDNINDPYFRENGEFNINNGGQKKNYFFEISVAAVLFIFIIAMIYLNASK